MVSGCCAVRAAGTSASTRTIGIAGSNRWLPTSSVSSRAYTNSPNESAQASTEIRRCARSNTASSRTRSPRATSWVSEGSSAEGTV